MPFEVAKFAETAWDSGCYFAQRGYYRDPSGQSSVAFFFLLTSPSGGGHGRRLALGRAPAGAQLVAHDPAGRGRAQGLGPTVRKRPVACQSPMPFARTRASMPFACSVRAARALVVSLGQPQ